MSENTKQKRTWAFIQSPSAYDISPCACGNHDTQWSEYEKHIWCAKCEIDFIPEHNGIFDGPIPINAAQMLGLHFTKVDLLTNDILVLDSDNEHMKCLNFADFFESKLIPISLKGLPAYKESRQDRKVIATAKLNYKTFLLENIVNFDSEFELNKSLTAEIIFNFPHKDTFKLHFRLHNGLYELQDTAASVDFKKYILHEDLQCDLGVRKTPVSRKI